MRLLVLFAIIFLSSTIVYAANANIKLNGQTLDGVINYLQTGNGDKIWGEGTQSEPSNYSGSKTYDNPQGGVKSFRLCYSFDTKGLFSATNVRKHWTNISLNIKLKDNYTTSTEDVGVFIKNASFGNILAANDYDNKTSSGSHPTRFYPRFFNNQTLASSISTLIGGGKGTILSRNYKAKDTWYSLNLTNSSIMFNNYTQFCLFTYDGNPFTPNQMFEFYTANSAGNVPYLSFSHPMNETPICRTAPSFYVNTTNRTLPRASENIKHNVHVKEELTISKVIFETNISTAIKNYTITTNTLINVTNKTSTTDGRYYWKTYANNTCNYWNDTNRMFINVDGTKPVIRVVDIPTGTLNPTADVTITDNLALSLCWYNITEQAVPNTCIGTCPTYFTCSTDPTLTGLNNLQSYRLWISANDTSNNRNITRAGIATFNWTINLGLSSGGAGGGGGGIRTSTLITELELSCGTRIFSFLYYTKPNKFSRDTICKNEGKSNLNAELEITEKLSKYVKAEFCDIDGLKCSNSINLFSGESGLLRIKAEISEEFKFEDGFINIRSGSKVNQFGVEIAPNIGYSIISLISSFTGISDTIAIWILFVFVLIVMVLLFYYGGI